MRSASFAYVWQFRIDPGLKSEFLAAYRPGGDWARLFSLDPDYIETALLEDADDPDRYLTIDYWRSAEARDAFRERFAEAFVCLDRQCERFTLSEEFVGDFTIMPPDTG